MNDKIPVNQGHNKERMYVIAWKRISGGPGMGRGTKQLTLNEATDLAIELNDEHKDFHHWIEAV